MKGHEYLIRAFAKLNAPGWELSLVGDGSLMKYLRCLALELQINDCVLFHGQLRDFSRELSEASIFVLPSLSRLTVPCLVIEFRI